MRSNQYRASPASIYVYWWVDWSTCLASRIPTEKESFPGSEFKPASIWTCWMLIDRQMQSAFMPELHRWISKLTARHLHHVPPGHLLITMVKEAVFCTKNEFRKMKKSRISHWSESDENAKWLRDCLWLCQACKRGFTCYVGLCKEIFARKHTATHKATSAQLLSAPLQLPAWHTSNKLADRHGAPRPPMTDVGTETAFRLEKAQAFPKK